VIEAWVGRTFDESHTILCVLLIAQLVATPMFVFRGVLFGMGAVRVPSILYAVEAVLNLILTLALIQPMGLMGVAIGTAIPLFLVELFIMLPYAMKQVDMSWSFLMRRIILPQVPPLVALFGYSLLVSSNWTIAPSWIPVVLVSVGGGAVLGAVWLVANEWLTSRRVTA